MRNGVPEWWPFLWPCVKILDTDLNDAAYNPLCGESATQTPPRSSGFGSSHRHTVCEIRAASLFHDTAFCYLVIEKSE